MDRLKRKFFLKYELKRILLKSMQRSALLPITYRYFVCYQKLKTPRWATLPQIVNRCVKTGRSLSITKKTHYSRFVLRTENYRGELPGFKRASW